MSASAQLKDSSASHPAGATGPSNGTASPNSSQQQPAHQNGERRTSFGFLRRQKSNDAGKMLKKQRGVSDTNAQPQGVPAVPPQLPTPSPLSKIPGFGGENARPDSYQIATNSYSTGTGTYGSYQQVPVPPIPSGAAAVKNGDHNIDPYARTESMTHRGRYSYASSAISSGTGINSPRRVRRRKDPTPYNILVIGERNSGKTSFIEFLRNALADKKKQEKTPSPPQTAFPGDSAFTPYYLETDIDHERIGVTLWDSQGLERKFVDLQLREMSSFLESKFEETFSEEQKVVRAPGVRDTHIHCVFLILDPTRLNANLVSTRKGKQTSSSLDEPARLIGALDEDLDIQVLKTLQGKTTVIPVISKADTITTTHMAVLKKSVWNSLKQAKIDPLEVLNVVDDSEEEGSFDERDEDAYLDSSNDGPAAGNSSQVIDNLADGSSDEGENEEREGASPPTSSPRSNNKDAVKAHRRSLSSALDATAEEEIPFLPMSIISPDSYEPGLIGRRFPWGFADPYNQEHCDFVRLKDAVFSEWRAELREASREVWYEGWRTSRLRKRDRAPSLGAKEYRKTVQAQTGMTSGAYRQGMAF
ncbi:uncharacterized protein PV09_01713 [Verruconis gallopava]|uniref:Septin-type G domain-containing protein n=1 Tax=Verruconis gallopava TaxID=253628 RepID=A0A0D1Z488_9PEZI|nr:uncharacterized protein PV09_01713 [Verruconis gallopava]KIW07787.1 hypothetical protein PV09_01713 [Verruconis gallopava]